MRAKEFYLSERTGQSVIAPILIQFLKSLKGIEDVVQKSNTLRVLINTPNTGKHASRQELMLKLEQLLKAKFRKADFYYNREASGSSIGAIVTQIDPVKIVVKDVNVQGDKSSGKANEHRLVQLMEQKLKEYGTLDVMFEDERGKKIAITGVQTIEHTGNRPKGETGGKFKADVLLVSANKKIPISIKQANAGFWESADKLFRVRAEPLLANLIKSKKIELVPSKKNPGKLTLPYAVVMEPTEEEQMITMFGDDLNPHGGIVIQDFQEHHFFQVESKVKIWCHAVIKSKEDIPESHLMVWRVRPDSTRKGLAGVDGIRPEASTLKNAIGETGERAVILVDVNGNIIKRPPRKDTQKPLAPKNSLPKQPPKVLPKQPPKPLPKTNQPMGQEPKTLAPITPR